MLSFNILQSAKSTISLLAALLSACGAMCAAAPCVLTAADQEVRPADLALARTRTIIDLTNEELLQEYPDDLAGVELDKEHQPLTQLLAAAGEKVAALFREYPKTTSKERVRREVLGRGDHVDESVTEDYYYSAYPRELSLWEEARTDSKGRPLPPERLRGSSMLTSGFASAGIFFHPIHQPGSSYRYLGRQSAEPYCHVIAFAQRPGIAQVTGSFLSNSLLPPTQLLYQGMVWIDPKSYQILRMRMDLLEPMPEVMLYRQTTEISFTEVRFGATGQAFWVPQEVVVSMEFGGRRYRNRHRYSDHQVFMVETQEKIELPKVKKCP